MAAHRVGSKKISAARPTALVFVVAAVGFALLLACSDSNGEPLSSSELSRQSRGWWVGGNLLFTSNRTELSVCVDGAEGYDLTGEEVDAVAEALENSLASVPDPPNEYAKRGVSEKCPRGTVLSYVGSDVVGGGRLDEYDWSLGDVFIGYPDGPSEPSEHLVFLYFVTPDGYNQSFDSEPYFRHTAESLIVGDVISGVTTALYVRSTATTADLETALTGVLNILPYVDDPAIDEEYRRNCELGTPELWCEGMLESSERAE